MRARRSSCLDADSIYVYRNAYSLPPREPNQTLSQPLSFLSPNHQEFLFILLLRNVLGGSEECIEMTQDKLSLRGK